MPNTKEQNTNETQMALIAKDISYMKSEMSEIKANFKELSGAFITKQALEDIALQTEKRLIKLENAGNLWRWLGPTLSAIFGSAVTFLLIQYLQNQR